MRRSTSTLLFAAVVGIAPALPVRAQGPSITRAAYDSSMRAFQSLLKRGTDIPAFVAFYSPNVTWVDPDGSMFVGRAQIEQQARAMFDAMTIKDWSIETTTFRSDGPVAYAAGVEHLRATDKKTGKPQNEDARFLVIMRAQPKGGLQFEYGIEAPMPTKQGGK